jgi:hypothetical protein
LLVSEGCEACGHVWITRDKDFLKKWQTANSKWLIKAGLRDTPMVISPAWKKRNPDEKPGVEAQGFPGREVWRDPRQSRPRR